MKNSRLPALLQILAAHWITNKMWFSLEPGILLNLSTQLDKTSIVLATLKVENWDDKNRRYDFQSGMLAGYLNRSSFHSCKWKNALKYKRNMNNVLTQPSKILLSMLGIVIYFPWHVGFWLMLIFASDPAMPAQKPPHFKSSPNWPQRSNSVLRVLV